VTHNLSKYLTALCVALDVKNWHPQEEKRSKAVWQDVCSLTDCLNLLIVERSLMKKYLMLISLCILVSAANAQVITTPPKQDEAALNSAFKLTPEQVKIIVSRAEVAAKQGKKLDDLVKPYRHNPEWTRGKKGKAHESYVWAMSFEGFPITCDAFKSASLYETNKLIENLKTTGASASGLNFSAVLSSMPRIARFAWESNKNADENEIRVVKFVLSDDHEHNLNADISTIRSSQSTGDVTFTGVAPQVSKSSGSTNATGSVVTPDGQTTSVTARANTSFTRTDYIPWSVQRPFYTAKYFVRFPMYDEQGHPFVTEDVKEITLHIITQAGELTTSYKIVPFK